MLEKTFKFYLSMEESTKFTATYFEKEVFEKMASVNNIDLYIKGYIDRIDTYNKGFRVLDYKSSNYTLVDNHILCGNKLQLVTYTKIIKDQLGLEAFGSYYSFYRSGKISVPAYTYSITKKIDFFDKQTLTDEFNKQYKLSGFTYEYNENCDDSTHIKGITNKNKVRGKAIIFSQVEKALEVIYQHLIQELCQGKIDLTPIEGACTYCHYQSICNYRGKKIKSYQQIVDLDLKNIEEKE
jgi:ATP-dependent helicase/DNAse subunit B